MEEKKEALCRGVHAWLLSQLTKFHDKGQFCVNQFRVNEEQGSTVTKQAEMCRMRSELTPT